MFKETSLAYSFDIAGLLAGFLVAYQLGVFRLSPWALALYPTLISTRVISGLLSGRLITALHLGTIYPRFSGNTKSFYKLIDAIIVLTLVTSLTVSLISLFFGYLLWGITLADFSAIVSVMVATLAIGLLFSLVTIKVAFVSFKRGLDPDIVVYPIISTAVSIFITLCYIGVLNLFFFLPYLGRLAILAIGFTHVFLVLYLISQDKQEPEFLKTISESLIMLMFVALMVTLTGTIFKGISNFAENRKEIYTIYPALINMVSNVGSVVGSTANTKLALGLLTPSFSSIKNHTKNITSAWVASFLIFTVLALISLAVNRVFLLSSVLNFMIIIWLSNIIAVIGIALLSYGISILTFKRGLDPDNFVIPVETSFATIVTSTALLLALLLIR
ncbi:MAG: magnesium transporter [Candidatus Bathyarchaeota archaeon]|nr:magnesium transporter [Candidatus Bathyarchaeota archaeon]